MQIHTLILTKNWQASRIAPWEEAFTLIFSGRAEIIEEHLDYKIKTINKEFAVPCVIRMVKGSNFERSKFRFSKKKSAFKLFSNSLTTPLKFNHLSVPIQ